VHLTIHDGPVVGRYAAKDHPSVVASTVLQKMYLGHTSIHGPLPLLPKLNELNFVVRGYEFSDLLFMDMLQSRWLPNGGSFSGMVTCLQSVHLQLLDRKMDELAMPALVLLRSAGMSITLAGH
jgi:hypothetical protein